jgi:hypothetical protein
VNAILAVALILTGPAARADSSHLNRYPVPTGDIGCSQFVETFCDKLWAPENLGNIELDVGEDPSLGRITLGRTKNETNYPYVLFSQAKLDARKHLPEDFRQRLEARGYFRKLERLLAHKPYGQMSKSEVEEVRALFAEVEVIWADALEDSASSRTSSRYPGFFKLTDERIPTKLSHAYSRTKDELEASIWQAIWSGHPRWKLVNRVFEEMKHVFLELIQAHPGISDEIRSRWMERIRGTRLMIPGSDPVHLNEGERRCASTDFNGYHWAERNAVVLCGGYILTGDPTRTIAHELAHSLGEYRAELEAGLRIPLAERLRKLRERTCTAQPYWQKASGAGIGYGAGQTVEKKGMTCAEWKDWKAGYAEDLAHATLGTEQDEKFLSCFQSKHLKGPPPEATIDYVAREWVQTELETQARRDRFIRLTKETEILRDGSVHPSPAYLDPCGIFYIYDGLDPYSSEFTLNVFFVNEYRCQLETSPDHCTKSPETCLEAAIEGAQSLEYALRHKGLSIQTKYSAVRELQRQGYAEDIEEDLSDHLGQIAYAKYLETHAAQAERRSRFLATVSTLCDEPSIAKLYPAEALVQKKYYIESHSEGLDRRRKLLIEPVRSALGCQKDFPESLPECDWYAPQGLTPKPSPKPTPN